MNKDKTFIGQPILAQIIKLIPKQLINSAVQKHDCNKYYKTLPLRTHLISSIFGVLSYCSGLRELCEGMLACEGKLTHLGLVKSPAKSTLSDANTHRSYRVFETIYFELLTKYHSFIADSRLKGLSIRNLKIIDSSTIQLFSEILKGVGRNPLEGNKKKGGFKVHAMLDAFSGVTEFVKITSARMHDKNFLRHLKLKKDSFIVFDKAYNHYEQFAKWTFEQVWFVTRMKNNAKYHVTKVITDHTKKKNKKGVLKEQYITLGYTEDKECKRLKLRRILFKADDGKLYVFITNNFKISCTEVARIYKYRWMIELLFKQIKQNFPLNYFWSNSVNGIKIQVYSVLIAQLLMVVIRKKAQTKKSFANMITVIRLHLMSYVDLFGFIKDTYKAWKKANPPPTIFNT